MQLGILDWCMLEPSRNAAYPLASTIELAKEAEAMGYVRYWLSEHHANDTAHSCPEILLSLLANETSTLRLGTAGILIRHHNCYKIAETFQCLQTLFGERIECGISCSQSKAAHDHGLLSDATSEQELDDKIGKLCALLRKNRPLKGNIPERPWNTWIMGGAASMRRAAKHSVHFGLDLMFRPPDLAEAKATIEEYRETCNALNGHPQCVLGIAGVCGDSDAAARAAVEQYHKLHPHAGIKPFLVGDQQRCVAVLEEVAFRVGVDSVVILDLSHGYYNRVRSYSNLMQGLAGSKSMSMIVSHS